MTTTDNKALAESKTVIYLLTDHPLCERSYQRDDGKWLTLERTTYTTPQPQGDASPEEVKAQDNRPPLPRLALPEHVGMLMGPDDCPRLLLNEVEIAVFPAGTWGEVCDALNFGGYVNPDATPQARPDGGAVDEVLLACPRCGTESYATPHESLYRHPAPAPDVARLVEATTRLLPTNVCLDNYNVPDREQVPLLATLGELRAMKSALAPFTAVQQKKATNGQE